jgi:hypothetical protein
MFHLKRFNTSQRGSLLQLNARLWLSALLWLSLAMHASAQNTSTSSAYSTHTTPASDKATQPVNSPSAVAVGSVSFLIGQASVTRSGSSLPITAGMPLQVGDRLLTSLSGHIHVRFVDGAMVSLRPTSTLNIKEYRFDAQTPSNSEVLFELEQGVVRAISGQAAETAKDKFRLNTPLAAIGVKGTDFVVEASGSRVNAIVNQGAIVLAPFDAQCLASALGPCSTQFAKELTAALKGMALTYNMSMPSPQLLPMGQLKGSELLNMALPMGAISQSGQSGPTANPSNLQLVQSSPENGANSGNAANAGNSGNSGNGSNSNSMTANRVQQNQVDGQAYSTVNQILNKTVSDTSLVWGRWGAANPQDNLTLAFKDAMQNRSVTVGDGYLFLFRQENNVANLLSAQQGNVNFTLQNSYAYFQDLGNNLNAAKVNSGTLGVNFSTLDVKTTLNLSTQPSANSVLGSSLALASPSASQANPQTPQTQQTLSQTLSATAKLNSSSGIFLLSPLATPPALVSGTSAISTPVSPTVAGALSLDTKQAGYLFTLPTLNGTFKGGTLWGR